MPFLTFYAGLIRLPRFKSGLLTLVGLAQTTKGTFNENSEQNNIFSSREESKVQSNNSSLQSYEELFSKVRITNAQKEGRNPNEDGAQA